MPKKDLFEQALAEARGGWRATDYSQRILIPDSRIAIASDVHIPYHDEKLLSQFFRDCEAHRIESIVWLGDLLDLHTFSNWGRTDYTTTFQRERKIARTVLEIGASVVGTQYWSRGNHEERIMRKNDHQMGMEELAYMVGVSPLVESGLLILSDNPTLDAVLVRGKPKWMLTHPAQYGSQPLVVPGKLATRYNQHVLSAHAHHWGMGVNETGKHTVIETGGLFQPNYHEYINYQVTAHRAWTQGYWFLIDGRPVGFRGGEDA